jgi:hypothetical protein
VALHTCVDAQDKAISCSNQTRQRTDALCPSTISLHHELLDKKQVKNNGIVDNSCMNETSFIAEYESEGVQNGGLLMQNLKGFDNFSNGYAPL